ncbi:hypothetical protein J5Y09_11875 [Roseomonas sp. PWR1]|uniref:DUF4239 domain-containing protein n=1 Tax=Roseomonas nitratireducens TaxID=2820810 RepID=A0ABS4AVM2_9PROT|nr:hypothetical protein [Neoroseomonas nitratireducens]MBP0464607.1 hypothetical protein [Neoroseomonas nitratireducens]
MENLVQEIAAAGALAFAAALFLVQATAREVGYIFGHRAADQEATPEGVGVVVGGMLGLLAFVLALTLSFASARHQERRDGTLAEANAIGTAWLRAQAIGHPRGTEIARLLEDYTRVRIDFVRADLHSPGLDGLTARTNAMQSEMWGHVTAIVRERPDPVATALMAALNEAFDLAMAERFAFSFTMPPQLFWLLIGMTTLTMAALGYQLGLRRRPLRILSFLLLAMWTATMTVILDLGAARVGDIRVGAGVYEWTLQGFEGGVAVPPLPGR